LIKTNFKQSTFEIYELQLPYCTVCTPSGDLTSPWHTPVTCEESSDATYSLWFTKSSAPSMQPPTQSIGVKSRLNSTVNRCVANASESTPRLKPGEGMASRGQMSLTMTDFEGDPGPIEFTESGTFFGKLLARNILDGKKILSHYYTITSEQEAPFLVSTSEHYITESGLSKGNFTLSAKDALHKLEAFSQKFPIPTEDYITADIDSAVTVIPVSDGALYSSQDVIIIDKELMRVQSVSSNNLTVYARGSSYVGTDKLIYKTEAEDHSLESTVQKCYVMNKAFLSNVLEDIYISSELTAFSDFTQWNDEITEWNANAFLTGVFHKPQDVDKVINKLLTDYMIDMWLDQSTQKSRVSANSSWKESQRTIEEGNDLDSLSTSKKANTRFSRAYIYNNKDFQSENDDEVNYSQLTLHKDTATEVDDFYGSVKVKAFDPSPYITPDSAFILVSRYVQRFARTPDEVSFSMEERKLAGSKIGDIVNIIARDSQTPSGETLTSKIAVQITEIKPKLNQVGRKYNIKALGYIPFIASGGGDLVIFISGTAVDVNLFARAGAPPSAINVTFVLDGATIGSTAQNVPSVKAGAFAPGSAIKIICTNSAKWSAMGGEGGSSTPGIIVGIPGFPSVTNGGNGGTAYESNGVTTSIYINYGTFDSYVTSGEVYAAGGGGASAAASDAQGSLSAASGGGGSGIPGGLGGVVAVPPGFPSGAQGNDGTFSGGGAGVSQSIGFTSAISGAGGFSLVGLPASASSSLAPGEVETSSPGQAGGAIKGTNVTVYNLAAQSGKFRDGNSDPYTLITA